MTDERKEPTSEEAAEAELELDRETVEDLDAAKAGEEVKGGVVPLSATCASSQCSDTTECVG